MYTNKSPQLFICLSQNVQPDNYVYRCEVKGIKLFMMGIFLDRFYLFNVDNSR